MPSAAVTVTQRGPVVTVTLDDPPTRNALRADRLAQVTAAIAAADADTSARVIVLTGAEPGFSAGWDLTDDDEDGGRAALTATFVALTTSRLPVIGRVEGYAFGAAIGLLGVCDIVVAARNARFGFTEVRLGTVAGLALAACSHRLRPIDSSRLAITGVRFDGSEAAAAGLVSIAVDAPEVGFAVDRVVDDVLAGGPVAIATTKQLLRSLQRAPGPCDFDAAHRIAGRQSASERREGGLARAERRLPVWPDIESLGSADRR